MSTGPVTRLNAALEGRYRIERELGEGGMATVYLARDERHNRSVALKVLKPELAAVVGAERFLAEIETTANLQHPHILPLFDSGEADGFLFYVMPYVEGESLRARLDREHQLPVDDAVRIATNVAEALDYAHRHGVIHRDIKPANILLQDGKPVISDFGIALAVSAGGGGRLTETGLSLGTPHYMSPEQATGDQHVGPATDIYALGCVLYEMLVGEPPFTGSTPQAILGKIIAGQASAASQQREAVLPHIDAAIVRALQRVPADRFVSVGDFAKALKDTGFSTGWSAPRSVGVEPSRVSRATLGFMAMSGALSAILAWLVLLPTPGALADHLSIYLPVGSVFQTGQYPTLAISHDGRTVAFQEETMLNVRTLDAFEAVRYPILGVSPFFSPDDQWVTAPRSGQRVRLDDGSLTSALGSQWGSSWGHDGYVIYAEGIAGQSGLWSAPAEGGETRQISFVDDEALETAHAWPQVLPEERGVLFTVLGPSGGWDDARLAVLPTGADRHRYLDVRGATYARYVPTGHILYTLADGTVMGASFDLGALTITGPAEPVLSGVRVASFGGGADWAISEEGTVAFMTGNSVENDIVSVLNRDGQVQRYVGDPVQAGWQRLSPDGERIAMTTRTPSNNDIVVVDFASGRRERWTFAPAEDETPVWSPDGDEIAYSAAYTGRARHVIRAGRPGDGVPDTVFTASGHMHLTDWSPDGEWLLGYQAEPTTGNDIWLVHADGTEPAQAVLATEDNEWNAAFSPDGRWVVYESSGGGVPELYVRSFPDFQRPRQLTDGGGAYPWFAPVSGELFFLRPDTTVVMSMKYDLEGGFSIEAPIEVFHYTEPYRSIDSRDGQTFVVLTENVDARVHEIRIIQGFFEELKRLVPN